MRAVVDKVRQRTGSDEHRLDPNGGELAEYLIWGSIVSDLVRRYRILFIDSRCSTLHITGALILGGGSYDSLPSFAVDFELVKLIKLFLVVTLDFRLIRVNQEHVVAKGLHLDELKVGNCTDYVRHTRLQIVKRRLVHRDEMVKHSVLCS